MDLNNVNEAIDDLSEKKWPEELFQDSWFFGNLLQTAAHPRTNNSKPRKKSMLRSFSEPCTSSSSGILSAAGKSYEEAYSSIEKLEEEFDSNPVIAGLKKAPSLPSRRRGHLHKPADNKKASNLLLRAPSLPAFLVESSEEFEVDDEEVEFSMGKLIRQASMKCRSSEQVLSRQRSIKGEADEDVIVSMEGSEGVITPQFPTKKLQPSRSLTITTPLKYEELQGFKDLGFQFERVDLGPSTNFQERRRTEEKSLRRSNNPIGESAWGGRSSTPPPVPRRSGRRSTSSSNDVMKEQIKFWARAVASNVRQEC